jgi:hypothetical protein
MADRFQSGSERDKKIMAHTQFMVLFGLIDQISDRALDIVEPQLHALQKEGWTIERGEAGDISDEALGILEQATAKLGPLFKERN